MKILLRWDARQRSNQLNYVPTFKNQDLDESRVNSGVCRLVRSDPEWRNNIPLFTGEFEIVIMIESVTEEMHGSD